MKQTVYIFLGGGLGSLMRFWVSTYTQRLWNISTFPMGTFLVNITGCFLIGILTGYFMKEDNSLRYLLITGFCGGYTTFSTFSAENLHLWQNGSYGILALYSILSLGIGFLAVALGYQLIKG